jgi:hypothetical protein
LKIVVGSFSGFFEFLFISSSFGGTVGDYRHFISILNKIIEIICAKEQVEIAFTISGSKSIHSKGLIRCKNN